MVVDLQMNFASLNACLIFTIRSILSSNGKINPSSGAGASEKAKGYFQNGQRRLTDMAGFVACRTTTARRGHIEDLHRELMKMWRILRQLSRDLQAAQRPDARAHLLAAEPPGGVRHQSGGAARHVKPRRVSHHLPLADGERAASSAGETARRSIIERPTPRRSGCCTRSWSR